ncbi:hypothetical protein BCR39DRAFT_523175 [Naematelia encephala]|uniref:Uncharacterized protein n=1 Tax=Naematelia encephala TaxID=71784 RepID=A0A1Y2BCS8_9TREE|nr:hypothetical protein BCR39DRAFT_523175 [Naematelia encephala]
MSREGGAFPTNPMSIPATKEAIQRHIDSGEISQADLEVLKKSYRTVAMGSTIGSILFSTGTYFLFRARAPQYGFAARLFAAIGAGSVGSLVGFTAGGVAASMQVNQNMPDSQRKMRVFAEIARESQEKMRLESIKRVGVVNDIPRGPNGRFPPPSSPSSSPSSSTSTWEQSVDGDRDQSQEYDGLVPDSSTLDTDGDIPTPIQSQVGSKTASTWDKLRAASPIGGAGGTRAATGASALKVEDERTREQREFDEMLEKERKGVDTNDRWT